MLAAYQNVCIKPYIMYPTGTRSPHTCVRGNTLFGLFLDRCMATVYGSSVVTRLYNEKALQRQAKEYPLHNKMDFREGSSTMKGGN